MAYLDRSLNPHRNKIIAGVVCLEALVIYGIVQGLDIDWTPRPEIPRPIATDVPLDPPKTIEPSPLPTPTTLPTFSSERPRVPPIPLDGRGDPLSADPGPIVTPTPQPTVQPSPDPIIPQHRFAPKAARPIGNPAGWVSTNDYPSRDLREGNQGTTGFELAIGTDGRVVACMVMRSSGFPGLDKATCDALSRRARFTPATDESGAKVAGRYVSAIRWVIPE